MVYFVASIDRRQQLWFAVSCLLASSGQAARCLRRLCIKTTCAAAVAVHQDTSHSTPTCYAGHSRQGPTLTECMLMHAVARLALHPVLTNIQVDRWRP